ncbi:MAG: hypothetical protein K2X74_23735 [Acetobacteraceae bacterium]|nr:hypothetical protein [Acetobacteraceae bacterium]
MSESKRERKAGRAERKDAATSAGAPGFTVVASGENVVLVNTHSGQSWVMGSDGGRPVWHPVTFEAGATRAPRRAEAKEAKKAAEEG